MNAKTPFSARRSILFLLMVGLALAVPGSALARKGPPGERGPKLSLKTLDRIAPQLGVEDAVLAQIKTRVYEAEKRSIELKAQLELAKLEMHRALDAESPDKAAVMGHIEAVGRLHTDLRKHEVGLMLDVRAMLTPEQRKTLRTLSARRDRGRRGKRGPRGQRGKRGPRGPDGRGGGPVMID